MEPDLSKFDASLVVIWFIAVITVILGALWTLREFKLMLVHNHLQHHLVAANPSSDSVIDMPTPIQDDNNVMPNETSPNINLPPAANTTSQQQQQAAKHDPNKHPITIHIGYIAVLVLLVIVVVMILLLYFFYNVMSE